MNVKVCDFRSNDFEQDFLQSIEETGFAVIKHHTVDKDVVRLVQMQWGEFFRYPQEIKNHWINSANRNFGYRGFKEETALGASKPDLKEYFHWQPGKDMMLTQREYNLKLFYQLEDVAGRLLGILDRNYDIPNPGFQDACFNSDNTILRALYYPAIDFSEELGSVRAAAHEDINFITLLAGATSVGLQVKDKQGNWHDVPYEDGTLICNVGDMLQAMSGGKYRSTTHRVINPTGDVTERISIPFFVHANSNTVIREGVTAQQFLQERLSAIHGRKS
jgi:isopenicillin N synthase-like dioxygenase